MYKLSAIYTRFNEPTDVGTHATIELAKDAAWTREKELDKGAIRWPIGVPNDVEPVWNGLKSVPVEDMTVEYDATRWYEIEPV